MNGKAWCAALLAAAVGLSALPAFADPIASGTDGKAKATPKEGKKRELEDYPKPDKQNKAKGTVTTVFKFHPEQTTNDEFTKFCGKGKEGVDKPKLRHVYADEETHGTSGAVDYNVSLSVVSKPDPKNIGKKIDTLTARVSAYGEIIPGSKDAKGAGAVSIDGSFADPFLFSDDNDQANYHSFEQGMDTSLELGTDTFFPTNLGPDGSWANGAQMSWRARVAPGLTSEPAAFWSDGAEGAIDLYSLLLTIDPDHQVHADLSFGSSNSFFDVDVHDVDGNLVSPGDLPAFTEAMESLIAGSFANGALTVPLSDLFSAGFVPTTAAEGDYTLGNSGSQTWNGAEPVPGPAALAIAATSMVFGGVRRRRG